MASADAAFTARRQFRNVLHAKEQTRDAWLYAWLDGTAQDVRHAFRSLRRAPGFTLTTILTLSIGIVATTVVFSVVDSLLFNAAPFRDADRLVEIMRWSSRGGGPSQPVAMLARWREQDQIFEQLEAHWEASFTATGGERAEIVWGSQVTTDLFRMLGVAPQRGRSFASDESDSPVVIISERLSRRRFGGPQEAVGQSLRLDGRDHVVVGVMPPNFRFPVSRIDAWVPFDPLRPNRLSPRGQVTIIGRLRAGVPYVDADQQVAALAPRLDESLASFPIAGATARLQDLFRYSAAGVRGQAPFITQARTRLFLIFGAAGVLLLLSSVNAANLFLSRALAQIHDLSVRAALGAGRARLVRRIFVEALIVAAGAAVVGIGGAAWLIQLAATGLPLNVVDDALNPIDLDARAVAWSVLAAGSAAVIAGLLPAVAIMRRDLSLTLRRHLDRHGHSRTSYRGVLLSLQTGLAVVLLIAGGLMARSLQNVLQVDTGWSGERVVILEPRFTSDRYATPATRAAFMTAITEGLQNRPGVEVTAVAEALPLRVGGIWYGSVEGQETTIPEAEITNVRVSPDYFSALGIRLERGRLFTSDDARQPVAVVSHSLAQQLAPDGNVLGKRFRFEETSDWLTVVGVVSDVRMFSVERNSDAEEVYRPLGAAPGPGSMQSPSRFVVVRTDGREGIAGLLRAQAGTIDTGLAVDAVTVDDLLRESMAERELNTAFLLGLSVFGLLLAGGGVYAVVAYETSRRTHELGIRMAFGATTLDILRVAMQRSVLLCASGAVFGLAGAFAAAELMTAMVYGISPYDVVTFATAVVFVLTIAAIAAFVPAHRATTLDPLVALRCE